MVTDEVRKDICALVREAGELIRGCTAVTERKSKAGTSNFVTRYDSLVQSFLLEKLSALVPGATFVGEEDGYDGGTAGAGRTFIIDPIDGTTNFLCGYMESAICVGLAEQGELELGVVYNPFRDEMFTGRRGAGAFLNGERLRLTDHALAEGVVGMDTAPYTPELRDHTFDVLRQLSYRCMDMRDLGSAALNICYVACGRNVAYLSPCLCVWDYAAASVILREAGGVLTGQQGEPLNLASHVPVLAATPRAHREILESGILV